MYVQIEVTTRCNFTCWYCAGRDMLQQDMQWEVFEKIVDRISEPNSTVSLQGEGEPTLHPKFWEMVRYVHQKGHIPYTIVNGSRLDVRLIAQFFPRVGVSIDTLDPQIAFDIGRHNLGKVLSNLEILAEKIGYKRIIVMTVDLGQPLEQLKEWVKSKNFALHIVQPLMIKDDYVRSYKSKTEFKSLKFISKNSLDGAQIHTTPKFCRFLYQDISRFYTKEGMELPCCFIKDASGIKSIQQMRDDFSKGLTPNGCRGCKEVIVWD